MLSVPIYSEKSTTNGKQRYDQVEYDIIFNYL